LIHSSIKGGSTETLKEKNHGRQEEPKTYKKKELYGVCNTARRKKNLPTDNTRKVGRISQTFVGGREGKNSTCMGTGALGRKKAAFASSPLLGMKTFGRKKKVNRKDQMDKKQVGSAHPKTKTTVKKKDAT